ncbi:MAG: hypothetical protein G01um101424_364 [Parcubacteria group bacterium Gr01-1014_24]|nr:MAG: hypothetical protein G01um101424_364 [Parcubacteria group bacterium Gr01-1014_24]
MLFLIDENLPFSVGAIFIERGFAVECVGDIKELRGKSDEIIFDYARGKQAIIVTRDLQFANPTRFALNKLLGVMVLRFPNEISITMLCKETERLTRDLKEEDFRQLLVIEPGSIRMRTIS